MTDLAEAAVPQGVPEESLGAKVREAMFVRQLRHYPDLGYRYFLLGIVILTTVILYYLYFVEGAVTPLLLPFFHMSFKYFLYLLVVSNGVGAFSAFIGGFSDKIGRANLAIGGLLCLGILQLIVPDIHTKLEFSIIYTFIGFIEGIVLVVTPALMRDYSPQMRRGSAMGFWAFGPTAGSLAASLVASHTLTHLVPFQDQFTISGIVCMVTFVVAFVFLRELAPALRDQLMVSIQDRALIEARARGLDVERVLEHPLRTMLKPDLLSFSFGVSTFLLIFYTSVSVITIYWTIVFNQTVNDANGINTWYWTFDCITLVGAGMLSDYFRVRKPFMAVGGIGSIVMMVIFLSRAHHPTTGYYSLVVIMSFLGMFVAMAYSPWMAAYTEELEARNPALSATGLAVWGWILRLVVAASFFAMPSVINTASPIIDRYSAATQLQAFQAAQPYVPPTTTSGPVAPTAPASVIAELRATKGLPEEALAGILTTYPTTHSAIASLGELPKDLQPQALGLIGFQPLATALQHGQTISAAQIAAVGKNSPQLAALLTEAEVVIPNQQKAPSQWQHWWWVCVGGEVVFLVTLLFMPGRWSSRMAKKDLDEREALVQAELAKLQAAPA